MPAHEKSALIRRTRKSQYACQATPTWTGTISISACCCQAMGTSSTDTQTQTPKHRYQAQTPNRHTNKIPQTRIDTRAKIPNTCTQAKHPSAQMRSTPSNPARHEWPSPSKTPSTTSKYTDAKHLSPDGHRTYHMMRNLTDYASWQTQLSKLRDDGTS